MDFDLTTLTDDQLDELRVQVLTEQERRTNLTAIPAQVADLCRTYKEGGGDPDLLVQAVTGAESPTP